VATARTAATKWAEAHPGTAVLAVDQAGAGSPVTVTIIGTTKPAIADLQRELGAALPQLSVTVQWVSGSILGRTTPLPPPTFPPATGQPASPVTPTSGPTPAPPPTPAPTPTVSPTR
jgi:hypothetical protein